MANPDSSASAGEQVTQNPADFLAAAGEVANQIYFARLQLAFFTQGQ